MGSRFLSLLGVFSLVSCGGTVVLMLVLLVVLRGSRKILRRARAGDFDAAPSPWYQVCISNVYLSCIMHANTVRTHSDIRRQMIIDDDDDDR